MTPQEVAEKCAAIAWAAGDETRDEAWQGGAQRAWHNIRAYALTLSPQPESAAPDLDDDPFNVANDFLDRPRPSEKHSESPRTFEYLLNAMEYAARLDRPYEADYAGKRKAVLKYVADLEAAQSARPAMPVGLPLLWNVHCMHAQEDRGAEWQAQWCDVLAAIDEVLVRHGYHPLPHGGDLTGLSSTASKEGT